jgi:hypothetical protein
VLAVAGDPDDLDVVVGERAEVVPDLAELVGAGAGEGERVEHDERRAVAAVVQQVAEGDVLAVLVGEAEVRGRCTDLEHAALGRDADTRHLRPFGEARRVPDQSGPR